MTKPVQGRFTKQEVGALIEDWRNHPDEYLGTIAIRNGMSPQTASTMISKHYFGRPIKKPMVITMPSKVNEPE